MSVVRLTQRVLTVSLAIHGPEVTESCPGSGRKRGETEYWFVIGQVCQCQTSVSVAMSRCGTSMLAERDLTAIAKSVTHRYWVDARG